MIFFESWLHLQENPVKKREKFKPKDLSQSRSDNEAPENDIESMISEIMDEKVNSILDSFFTPKLQMTIILIIVFFSGILFLEVIDVILYNLGLSWDQAIDSLLNNPYLK